MKRVILWFRNDLRLHDNYILEYARKINLKNKEVVPVFCFDPRIFKTTTKYNTRKTGIIRAKFILETVKKFK